MYIGISEEKQGNGAYKLKFKCDSCKRIFSARKRILRFEKHLCRKCWGVGNKIYPTPFITIPCSVCKTPFQIRPGAYHYRLRNGHKTFVCSPKCRGVTIHNTRSLPESRAKTVRQMKKRWTNPKERIKHNKVMKKYWSNPHNKERFGQLMKKSWSSEKRVKQGQRMKKHWSKSSNKNKHSLIMKKLWANPKERARRILANKNRKLNPQKQIEHSRRMKKIWSNPKKLAEHHRTMKERWANPEYWDKCVRSMCKSWTPQKRAKQRRRMKAKPLSWYQDWMSRALQTNSNGKMTKPERIVLAFIKENRLPFRYTGNGTFPVERLFPDFVSTGGPKRVVLVHGCWWHKCQKCFPGSKGKKLSIRKHLSTYKKHGWRPIVIWEHDLKRTHLPAWLFKILS